MTQTTSLDLNGSLDKNPFAELAVEIRSAGLGGALRIWHGERKIVIYFRDGLPVYAVSNAAENRLVSLILEFKKVDKEKLAALARPANEIELGELLVQERLLTKAELDRLVRLQIDRVLDDAIGLEIGDFVFSPLVKARADLTFPTDLSGKLVKFARTFPTDKIVSRFKCLQETFTAVADMKPLHDMQTHEYFVYQQFGKECLSVDSVLKLCPMPEAGVMSTLYVLWLSGLISRKNWNSSFSDAHIAAIRNARFAILKEAKDVTLETVKPEIEEPDRVESDEKVSSDPTAELSVDEYLRRAEKSDTYYDIFGLSATAGLSEIKRSYFALAKGFHPDRFHREPPAKLAKIQTAFSVVQQAYETLKSPEARQSYDMKKYKEIEAKEKLRAVGITEQEEEGENTSGQALGNFEAGLNLLLDDEFEASIPFLARAAHFSPDNALYRAYYGKALSFIDGQHHKAESEMQMGVKLDPQNVKIRFMLAEFFYDMDLMKRAEAELKRVLEISPNHTDARALLSQIRK